jgi:hypothetical protein
MILWTILGIVMLLCTGALVWCGLFLLSDMFSGYRQDTFEKVLFGTLLLLVIAMIGVCGFGTYACLNEAYIYAVSTEERQTVTVESARQYSQTNVHTTYITVGVPPHQTMIPNTYTTTDWYTEVTLKEFPGQTFTANGAREWKKGDQVTIVKYVLKGDWVRTDFD